MSVLITFLTFTITRHMYTHVPLPFGQAYYIHLRGVDTWTVTWTLT